MEAHANKLIDYRKFNALNLRDILREKLIFEELEVRLYEKLSTLVYLRKCSALGFSPQGDRAVDVIKAIAIDANEAFKRVGTIVAPWLEWSKNEDHHLDEADTKDLLKRWEAAFGKLDDPAVQKKINEYKNMLAKKDMPEGATVVNNVR